MSYTCKNCGVVADDPGHLCNPSQEKVSCEFCGEEDVSAKHICKNKLGAMKFTCETCGGVAPEAAQLCHPKEIT